MLKSHFTKDKIEAGLDEAGRGCLAGPVVAAAVILPKGYKHKLLNDSKKLAPKQRELLRVEIEKEALHFAVGEVSEKEIDEINILNASFKAMHIALDSLYIPPELLLIDGNRFKKYKDIPHECIIQGDGKFLSIAAASILAKTYRDDLMSRLAREYPQYGWDHNMGYATEFHRTAIGKYGYSPLHRLSFNLKSAQLELF
jgi:ribonuclease HII